MKVRLTKKARCEQLVIEGCKRWDSGDDKAAFRFFLAAAKAGDTSGQINAGYCYDTGKGVRVDREKALAWYRLAYRKGDGSAATNIGTVWRDAGQTSRALAWFQKAVKLGDEDAYLEMAKLYLRDKNHRELAMRCLERVVASDRVTENSQEEAAQLLKRLRRIGRKASK